MGDRAAKRLKTIADDPDDNTRALQALLHTGNVSSSALLKVVRQLQANPTVHATRRNLGEANLAGFMAIRIIEQIDMLDGSTFNWEYSDPNRLLTCLVDSCPRLRAVVVEASRRHPSSQAQPWNLVVGFDEFTPGNVLRQNNDRKTMALSYSFLEFGQQALWHESIWMTPIVVRHKVIANVVGGWSAMFKRYLLRHLYGPTGLAVAGLPLEIDGQVFVLWARLSNVLGDGDGLRMAYEWRGAASLRPCLRHGNVLKLGSNLAHRDPNFVEIDCCEAGRFQLTRAAELYDMVDAVLTMRDRVASGVAPQIRLKDVCVASGLSCTRQGLLADPTIRARVDILGTLTYDWLHAALQDGTMNVEVGLCLGACSSIGITSEDIKTHLEKDWTFPRSSRSKSKVLYKYFDHGRKGHDIKPTASDMLSLYALLRFFFETRAGGRAEVKAQLDSFQAACACVDILLKAKRCLVPMRQAAQDLRSAVSRHFRLHREVYGSDKLKPKHHWLYDVCDQMERDPYILDCFIVERLHLRAKAMANDVLNTSVYERSVLASMLNLQRNTLQTAGGESNSLVGRVVPFPSRPLAQVGDHLEHAGRHISVGDLVFHGEAMGSVIACASESGSLYVVVEPCIFIRKLSVHSDVFVRCPNGGLQVWQVALVEPAVAWIVVQDLQLVVLRW